MIKLCEHQLLLFYVCFHLTKKNSCRTLYAFLGFLRSGWYKCFSPACIRASHWNINFSWDKGSTYKILSVSIHMSDRLECPVTSLVVIIPSLARNLKMEDWFFPSNILFFSLQTKLSFTKINYSFYRLIKAVSKVENFSSRVNY